MACWLHAACARVDPRGMDGRTRAIEMDGGVLARNLPYAAAAWVVVVLGAMAVRGVLVALGGA